MAKGTTGGRRGQGRSGADVYAKATFVPGNPTDADRQAATFWLNENDKNIRASQGNLGPGHIVVTNTKTGESSSFEGMSREMARKEFAYETLLFMKYDKTGIYADRK